MAVRVALSDMSDAKWSAGGVFTEMIVRSLRHSGLAEADVFVLGEIALRRWQDLATFVELPRRLWGEDWIRRQAHLPCALERLFKHHQITTYVGALHLIQGRTRCRRVAWIPDFQHKHLPNMYSESELSSLDSYIHSLAQQADAVLLSSNAALADFARFFPAYLRKARALPFPSLFAYAPPSAEVGAARVMYNLPEKYVLVANQFWMHKNHRVVVDAVQILARRGITVPIVFTGLPSDYRDPTNSSLSTLLQRIAAKGVHDRVTILGLVPREHLIDLLRSAACIVQPSRFEGWSTSIQDARAIGRPVICSDIPVHREQAPDSLGFFSCDDAQGLAGIIERSWSQLAPGPDYHAEQVALARHVAYAQQYAGELAQLCRSDS